jgi:hypothetical protein
MVKPVVTSTKNIEQFKSTKVYVNKYFASFSKCLRITNMRRTILQFYSGGILTANRSKVTYDLIFLVYCISIEISQKTLLNLEIKRAKKIRITLPQEY